MRCAIAVLHRLYGLSNGKRMLVKLQIYSSPPECHALQAQTQALFRSSFRAQLDFAARAHHALPRNPIRRLALQEARHRAVIQRVACRLGHLAVSCYLPLWNRDYNTPERCLISFRARLLFERRAGIRTGH